MVASVHWMNEITEQIIEHQESLSDSERGSQIFVGTQGEHGTRPEWFDHSVV